MYGRLIGTLELKANDEIVWNVTGQQNPEWIQAKVKLPAGNYNVIHNFFLLKLYF